jgi:hypothetical protein
MLLVASGDGRLRGSLPKVNSTTLSTMMPPATVAMSQASELRSTNGRTRTRSTIRPKTAQPASASGAAIQNGRPNVIISVKPRTEPTIIALPCAKFTVFETV